MERNIPSIITRWMGGWGGVCASLIELSPKPDWWVKAFVLNCSCWRWHSYTYWPWHSGTFYIEMLITMQCINGTFTNHSDWTEVSSPTCPSTSFSLSSSIFECAPSPALALRLKSQIILKKFQSLNLALRSWDPKMVVLCITWHQYRNCLTMCLVAYFSSIRLRLKTAIMSLIL